MELHLVNYKKMYAKSLQKMEALPNSVNRSVMYRQCNHLSMVMDEIKDIYVIIDPGYRPALT
jgi:hypothetical protein